MPEWHLPSTCDPRGGKTVSQDPTLLNGRQRAARTLTAWFVRIARFGKCVPNVNLQLYTEISDVPRDIIISHFIAHIYLIVYGRNNYIEEGRRESTKLLIMPRRLHSNSKITLELHRHVPRHADSLRLHICVLFLGQKKRQGRGSFSLPLFFSLLSTKGVEPGQVWNKW